MCQRFTIYKLEPESSLETNRSSVLVHQDLFEVDRMLSGGRHDVQVVASMMSRCGNFTTVPFYRDAVHPSRHVVLLLML